MADKIQVVGRLIIEVIERRYYELRLGKRHATVGLLIDEHLNVLKETGKEVGAIHLEFVNTDRR